MAAWCSRAATSARWSAPLAQLKVFLTASVEERARRRQEQLLAQGVQQPLDELAQDLARRDDSDAGRTLAPLRKADDAVEVDTTHLTIDEVVGVICALAVRRGRERATLNCRPASRTGAGPEPRTGAAHHAEQSPRHVPLSVAARLRAGRVHAPLPHAGDRSPNTCRPTDRSCSPRTTSPTSTPSSWGSPVPARSTSWPRPRSGRCPSWAGWSTVLGRLPGAAGCGRPPGGRRGTGRALGRRGAGHLPRGTPVARRSPGRAAGGRGALLDAQGSDDGSRGADRQRSHRTGQAPRAAAYHHRLRAAARYRGRRGFQVRTTARSHPPPDERPWPNCPDQEPPTEEGP